MEISQKLAPAVPFKNIVEEYTQERIERIKTSGAEYTKKRNERVPVSLNTTDTTSTTSQEVPF